MNLQTFAVAALLLGSAAVLTVVATNPSGADHPAPATRAGYGALEMLVHSEGDAGKAHLTATRANGEVVYAELVDLPARADWRYRVEVPLDAYEVALRVGAAGWTSGSGDLRDCVGGHAVWEGRVRYRGPLAEEFGSHGAACVEGYAAAQPPPPAETGAMRGSQTIGFAYTGPSPGCLPPQCEGGVSHAGSVVRFELDRPAAMLVRAAWDPATPAAERMSVSLWRELPGGQGEWAGGADGAREVQFEVDGVPGMYRFAAYPDGPVGAAVSQDINYEATWVYR